MKDNSLNPIIIAQTPMQQEMSSAYLDYSLSVIINRALPDARDGLKPVQRRILYAMRKAGYDWSKPYKKSAGTVGDTLKNYHPHGNAPVYEAMVRMAQPFSLRLPLIDGQGNFGSLDGDPPAAERYTEARLDLAAKFILHDDDMNAVPYEPNYDNSTVIARILPVRFPNLLVNGASGIAVGMATNIPPHNLNETLDACSYLLDNPNAEIEDLIKFIPAPDFPLGGEILDPDKGILKAYKTGRGSFNLRGTYLIEEGVKTKIIITTIPYQVNKAKLIENIASLVKSGEIDQISDLRDESNEEDIVRIVIEIKKNANEQVIINQLINKTQFQISIHFNMLAVLNQQPLQMNLKQMLSTFLAFREDVITERTLNALNQHKATAHKLWGLALALGEIDKVIECIKQSKDTAQAEENLQLMQWNMDQAQPFLVLLQEDYVQVDGFYHFSAQQAQAILELKLHRLTKLEFNKLDQEVKALAVQIAELYRILNDRSVRIALMKEEFEQVKKQIGSPRLTLISNKSGQVQDEDLIEDNLVIVILSMSGYIKCMDIDLYRTQHRGGKGKSTAQHEDDVANLLLTSTSRSRLLFFSNIGKVYACKTYQLPQASNISKGKAIVNILPLDYDKGEKITSITCVPSNSDQEDESHIVFVTQTGKVRKNAIQAFDKIQTNGKKALDQEEVLVAAMLVNGANDLLLASENGKAIRFATSQLRVMQSRESAGVIGMNLKEGDKIVSALCISGVDLEETANVLDDAKANRLDDAKANKLDEQYVLTISTKGYGKKTPVQSYRQANRGGMGVSNMELNNKTGKVLKSLCVNKMDEIILLTLKGQIIRLSVSSIRSSSRVTQGIMLVKLDKDDCMINASVVQAIE